MIKDGYIINPFITEDDKCFAYNGDSFPVTKQCRVFKIKGCWGYECPHYKTKKDVRRQEIAVLRRLRSLPWDEQQYYKAKYGIRL